MLRLRNTLTFLLLSFLLVWGQSAWATHVSNGHLSYTCLGGNTYQVQLELYRSCSGVAAPASATVSYGSASCMVSGSSLSLSLQSSNSITNACSSILTNCNGGTLNGYERNVYTGTVTLPINCPDWQFSYSICCRSTEDNLQNAMSSSFYVEAALNNTTGCNTTPSFTGETELYACVNQPLSWSPGAVDADGDSLAFELQAPLGSSGSFLAFSAGYSASSPIPSSNGFFFDGHSGTFSTIPVGAGSYAISILVKEYRNGSLIGTSIYELGITLTSNCNTSGASHTVQNLSNLSLSSTGDTASTCSNSFSFDMVFTDVDAGDTVNLLNHNLDELIGVGNYSISSTGATNAANNYELVVSVNVSNAPANTTSPLLFVVEDNNCPFSHVTSGSLFINTGSISLAISNTLDSVCTGVVSQLSASPGFSTYTWSSGQTTADISAFSAGTYHVSVTGTCGNFSDSIVIGAYPELTFDLGANQSIPLGGSASLYIQQSNLPTQPILWTPNVQLSCAVCDTTVASPTLTQQYVATTESLQGCTDSDTILVDVYFNDPTDTITALIAADSSFNACFTIPTVLNPSSVTANPQYGNFSLQPSSNNCFSYTSNGTANVSDNFSIILCEGTTGYCDTTVVLVDIGSCVWAGDTDTDQLVNNFDLLPIGLGMGETGAVRPNADLNFDCELAMPWANATPGLAVNYKHSDTDGDGVVTTADTTAVGQNWGQFYVRNSQGSSSSTGAPFFVQPTSTMSAQQVSLPVILGDTANPVISAYGVAFTVSYDANMVEQGSVGMQFNPSWLGTQGTNLLAMYRDYPGTGQLEVAITRTDGQSTAGFGTLCHIDLTIKDDIMRNNTERLDFSISNVRLIDAQGSETLTNPQMTQVLIEVVTGTEELSSSAIRLFPNPVSEQLTIQSSDAVIQSVQVWNSLGQELRTWNGQQSQLLLSVQDWTSGWYTIRVETDKGWETKRVQVIR